MIPNADEFWRAVGLLLVATPLMFGTLTLFVGLTELLARWTAPAQDAEQRHY